MKKITIQLFLIFSFAQLFAQKNDNVMVLGYHYFANGPIPTFDFTYGSPDTGAYFSPIDVFGSNASICDSSGLMMMYTNGISLVNRYQQILPGSNLFNADPINTMYNLDSYNFPQIAIIIPAPGESSNYYIFHTGLNQFQGNIIQPNVLSYSKVDMNMNQGAGQMTLKNQPLLTDTFAFSTLQAVKHANGRDWWIVIHKYNSSIFYSSLVTTTGIQANVQSQIGPTIYSGINGQSTFSPDGSRFAFAANDSNFLALYSFDRCNGTFTYDTIVRKSVNVNGFNFSGCSFSPNNQFLYASDLVNLYQYDVTLSDVPASEKLIATTDLFPDPYPSYFNHHCTGPDGKIYFSTGNACAHLHVINEPNLTDTNCNFVQHQQKIINYGNTVPTFPNYRLGALGGSVCDSLITTISSAEITDKNFKTFPNPSSNNLNVEYESNNSEIQQLKITDISGKIYFHSEFISKTKIDVSSIPAGMYFLYVNSDNAMKYLKITIIH